MDPVTIASLNQQFDDLQAAVAKEESDITTYIDGLKAQIAAGGLVTQADLDALSAKVTGLNTMVGNFDIATTAAPVPPPPLPPVAAARR